MKPRGAAGGIVRPESRSLPAGDPCAAPSVPVALAVLLVLGVAAAAGALEPPRDDPFLPLRRDMVEWQIRQRGIRTPGVLQAMEEVPRHLFVPDTVRADAYADQALPIGSGQTILQPYLVAVMTDLMDLRGAEKVLEIGTGTGYQAAILSRLVKEVYTIEILEPLAERARQTLGELGYANVHVRTGDGYQGWPEAAPFDAILVTAAPEAIPQPLVDQLRVGGRMVIPVGNYFQDLLMITKTPDGIEKKKVGPVRFDQMQRDLGEPPR